MQAHDSMGGLFDLFNCCRLGGADGVPGMKEVEDRNTCGVGINFQPDATGALAVHSVVPGSPAAEDALICQGDLLEQVDGANVYRCSLKQVSGILLGPEGSVVRISFQRPTPNGSTVRVEVLLRRRDIRRLRAVYANALHHTSSPTQDGMHGTVPGARYYNAPPAPSLAHPPLSTHPLPTHLPSASPDKGGAQELLRQAQAASEEGRVVEAQELYLKALRSDPSDVDAMCGLATLLHTSRSDLLQAEALYQHALRLDPRHVRSLCSYGLLLRDKYGDDTGGEVFFKRALEADPTDTDTLCNYALLLTNVQKDHKRAADMFEQALQYDPSHVRTLCGLGMLVQKVEGDPARAKALFSRALQVLYRDHLGERKAAESLIQHALKMDPNNPWLKSNASSFTVP